MSWARRHCIPPLTTTLLKFSPAEPHFPLTPHHGPQHPRLRRVRRGSRREGPCKHGLQPVFHGNDPVVLLLSRWDPQERHGGWDLLLFLVCIIILCVSRLIYTATGHVFNSQEIGFIKWCSLLYRNHENILFRSPPLDWSEQVVVITGGQSTLLIPVPRLTKSRWFVGASGVGELLANTLAVRNVTVVVLDVKPIVTENCERNLENRSRGHSKNIKQIIFLTTNVMYLIGSRLKGSRTLW